MFESAISATAIAYDNNKKNEKLHCLVEETEASFFNLNVPLCIIWPHRGAFAQIFRPHVVFH